jgi:hypothetical protein
MSNQNRGGGVVIAPNIKKTSVKINERGDIIDSFEEKNVIQQVQEEFIPPTVETTGTPLQAPEMPKQNKLEAMIAMKLEEKLSKIDEMVEKKIEEVLNKIM